MKKASKYEVLFKHLFAFLSCGSDSAFSHRISSSFLGCAVLLWLHEPVQLAGLIGTFFCHLTVWFSNGNRRGRGWKRARRYCSSLQWWTCSYVVLVHLTNPHLYWSLVPHTRQEGVREWVKRSFCFWTCFLVPSGKLFLWGHLPPKSCGGGLIWIVIEERMLGPAW